MSAAAMPDEAREARRGSKCAGSSSASAGSSR